jgi:hypothetical protein
MALLSLQRGLSLLLAALVACVFAQDVASDVKSIPLRTHSLSQVRGTSCMQIDLTAKLTNATLSPTSTPISNPVGSTLAAAPSSAPTNTSA